MMPSVSQKDAGKAPSKPPSAVRLTRPGHGIRKTSPVGKRTFPQASDRCALKKGCPNGKKHEDLNGFVRGRGCARGPFGCREPE
ncbi:hypothetical protein HMPREF9440_01897 [Sutterella parvirubra YIT 11816]|uniref:Uncharacterized protein n=1 Tax=Sutterella parvirubra YIT 11816 TaxID=762967 RepID=H3KGL5_9BURK|nr:hypothetical protein HMPREF9440_01897 [Sutterella parvirubra YIT 11816]